MTPSPKVFFLALDAASKDLVLPWSEEGLLPAFRCLLQTSRWGVIANAPGVYTGSVWPSIWTGLTPGRHGCYYCEQLVPGSYQVTEFLGRNITREPFWMPLSRAGKRVALFDVPKAPLAAGLNGLQIVDWGTHDADLLPCSCPADLIGEVSARYGVSPFRRCDWIMQQPGRERELRDHLIRRIANKTAIAEDLLAREPWDLFMVSFGDSHCAGHQLWHVHDPSHPRHDPRLAASLGDPVRDVYAALDQALGNLLRFAGRDTTVIVLLSHGMSAHYDATYLLDDILRRLEGAPASAARIALDRARRLWKRLPLRFTERLKSLAVSVNTMPDAADRARRRCFAVPTNSNSGGIRLNLAGREPNGLLQPGGEAEQFVARLIGDLRELREAASGRPLVREILRSSEHFPGERSSELPDLFVQWNRDQPISGAVSPKIGRLVREDTTTRRTGDHRSEGLYFLRGPGIAAGRDSSPAAAEDFAPTISVLLGAGLDDVDGRCIA